MSASLRESGILFTAIQRMVTQEEREQESYPLLLKHILRDKLWQERFDDQLKRMVKFDTFEQCVTTPPLEGLGVTIDLLKKLARGDNELIDLIDQATARKPGDNQYTMVHNNIMSHNETQGTSSTYALRKLRKDAPEIHKLVIKGELSPHAGMIKAGFRKKTITIIDDPKAVGETLLKHFNHGELGIILQIIFNEIN